MNDSSELSLSPETYDQKPPLASEKAAHQAKLRERLKQVQAAKIAEKQTAKEVAKPTGKPRGRQAAIRDTTETVTTEMMQPKKPTKAQIKAAEKVAIYEASQKSPEDEPEDPSINNDLALMTDDEPVKENTSKTPAKKTDKRREYEKVGREILKQRKWAERENALLDRVRDLISSEFSVGYPETEFQDEQVPEATETVNHLALYDDQHFAKLIEKHKPSTPKKAPRTPAFKSFALELKDLY